MSEFFKALEQAERDRRRVEEDGTHLAAEQDRPEDEKHEAPRPVAAPAPSALRSASPPAPRSAREPESERPPTPRLAKPKVSRARLPILITQTDPNSLAAESYRTVRANLEFSRLDKPFRNVAITSPTAGGGKSTTASNLAVVAAQSGWRVCLVDADFHRPVLHNVFGLPNTGGLTAALEGRPFQAVVRDTGVENLSLVVSGQNGSGPTRQLFTTQRLERVFRDAGSQFDLIVYDTPPIISVADAVNVAALCDGVILVVRYGSVPPSVLRRAARQITQVNGRILGVLLNQVNLRGGDDDVYRYYSAYHDEKPRQ
jgi:capsular exopolysaccharide synthesis family protein